MAAILTEHQRQFAHHVLMFDRPLAYDLSEALQRSTLACFENNIAECGITEFFCGLYLQYKDELRNYFNGDMPSLVRRVLPKHRFGNEGLVPAKLIENAASDGESCDSGVFYSIRFSD